MELPKKLVSANGLLNDEFILKKEILYQGINGNIVERFYLSPTESYVFKPITGNGSKEVWVYEHILPSLPSIYPKMLAHSTDWVIYEDLGELSHDFSEENVAAVTKLMAYWHSLPYGNLGTLAGLKPSIKIIAAEVLAKQWELKRLLLQLDMDEELILGVYSLLEVVEFSQEIVLSHGDLHIGNYAFNHNRLIVLDWEHTHINLPYWDLYHVLDMSHPLFSKEVTSQFRDQVLNIYLDHIAAKVDREAFLKEYYLFSSVFSMWMVLLIFTDLQSMETNWSKEHLEAQLNEQVLSLIQCASSLQQKRG